MSPTSYQLLYPAKVMLKAGISGPNIKTDLGAGNGIRTRDIQLGRLTL